jgi:hypothetical protein
LSYGIPPYGPSPGLPPNPYAAPQAPPLATAAGGVPGAALKWSFLAGYASFWVIGVGGFALVSALVPPDDGGSTLAAVVMLVGMALFLMAPVSAVVWLYQAWSSVPPELRYTSNGTAMSPGKAIGFLFIPLFNLFWIFMANIGLCDAVNRTLAACGGPPRAPRGVAIAACVTQVIPYCNFLVAPILWAIYMFQMDAARSEMIARLGPRAPT